MIVVLVMQVSHHPMIVACHCEGRGWKFWGDSNLKSKFWGRSIQVDPVGTLTLKFDDGEMFQWTKVPIFCSCLFVIGASVCSSTRNVQIKWKKKALSFARDVVKCFMLRSFCFGWLMS
jgi:hypothetical protein